MTDTKGIGKPCSTCRYERFGCIMQKLRERHSFRCDRWKPKLRDILKGWFGK